MGIEKVNDVRKSKSDLGEIRQTISLILEPGNVAEIRVLNTSKGTISGYYSDHELMAKAAASLSGRGPGIYMTLNPVNPDLLSRSANQFKSYAKHTTADQDIIRRRWLLVDFDPKRPSGISSTDLEHQAALKRAGECATYLVSVGCLPDAIVLADSGNGGHLLLSVDLPNEPDSSSLLQKCLQALDFRFSDETVAVDLTTYNAARISKIYGTLTAKGDSTPERPHRLAHLIKAPPQLAVTPRDFLEKLAAKVPAKPKVSTNRKAGIRFDVAAWIAKHRLKVSHTKPWNGGTLWVLAVCPWDPAHSNGEAFIVQFADGAITAGCHHNSCSGKTWKDLRQMIDGGPASTSGGGMVVTGKGSGDDDEKKSQATKLTELAEGMEFFHTPDGEPYATFVVDKHLETWPLSSKSFKRWLKRLYYEEYGGAPNTQSFTEALGVMEGRAQYDGQEHNVFTRFAEYDGKIYLDLANPQWETVEVSEQGWQILGSSPVKFRRPMGMLALPNPVHGGSLEALRSFLNISSDSDWALVKAWLVQTCRPKGPYPIILPSGEAGATKTTFCRLLRATIDPNSAPLRSEPRDLRDLMIAARNSWIVAFDNLSHLPIWLSDALCRLATGGGFATRELYTDDAETIIDVMRAVILNSIENIAVRGDFIDRSISLTLLHLDDDKRRTEKELWAKFRIIHPGVLGALLDAVSTALFNEPNIKLVKLPRMADFAIWATAAEPALGLTPGEFMKAYTTNRKQANQEILDNSKVASALITLMAKGGFYGTPTQFLSKVNGLVDENTLLSKSWPKSPKGLRGQITKLAPQLRTVGIEVEYGQTNGPNSERTVTVRKVGAACDATAAPDATGPEPSPKQQAQTKAQLTLKDLEVTQPSSQSDGCVTCDRSYADVIAGQTKELSEYPEILGMSVEEAIELWRSAGAPVIYLGPRDNCFRLDELLADANVKGDRLEAVRRWLDSRKAKL